jgi:hypothetical protein
VEGIDSGDTELPYADDRGGIVNDRTVLVDPSTHPFSSALFPNPGSTGWWHSGTDWHSWRRRFGRARGYAPDNAKRRRSSRLAGVKAAMRRMMRDA